jgi:uncharacterized membrane protein
MNIIKIIGATLFIIGLILVTIGVTLCFVSDKTIVKTDCYDNYGHKIIGLTCEKEQIESNFLPWMGGMFFVLIGEVIFLQGAYSW